MPLLHIALHCPACRRDYLPQAGLFGCPHARPDREHTLEKQIQFPDAGRRTRDRIRRRWDKGLKDPFAVFRDILTSRALLDDAGFLEILGTVQQRLESLEGRPFRITPLVQARELATAIGHQGRLWIKDETGNVSGSHKARHLMGSLLYIEALRRLQPESAKPVLAVYSCGNAALGAAVVARAGGYELHAFVPEKVDAGIERMLRARNVRLQKLARRPQAAGDPCYLAFQRAVREKGWRPFSCSGNDNWSNIEGGETLAWETLMQLRTHGCNPAALVLQVGGGALARSVARAFKTAKHMGMISVFPKIFVCQPQGGFPFVRAYLLALSYIAQSAGLVFDLADDPAADPLRRCANFASFARTRNAQIRQVAEFARRNFETRAVQRILEDALHGRKRLMWPWDAEPPHSLAHGILDDVTYDWYELLRDILKSGGRAVVVAEKNIARAWELAGSRTSMAPCATGSAGLAGFLQLQQDGDIGRHEAVVLFFTGRDRRNRTSGFAQE